MFKWRSKVISLQVNEDVCSGCGNCVIRCKRNVFALIFDKGKYLAVIVSPEACKGCNHCKEVCKNKAIEIIIQ